MVSTILVCCLYLQYTARPGCILLTAVFINTWLYVSRVDHETVASLFFTSFMLVTAVLLSTLGISFGFRNPLNLQWSVSYSKEISGQVVKVSASYYRDRGFKAYWQHNLVVSYITPILVSFQELDLIVVQISGKRSSSE